MRRVRLEKLCETKNCQADRNGRRSAAKRLGSGRATSSPSLSASAFCARVSAVRSSTAFSPVDRGDFTASRGAMSVRQDHHIIKETSCFLEAITDAVERFDHFEVVVDDLELLAQAFD